MYKRVVFGTVTNHKMEELTDLNFREKLVLIPIFIFIVWIGIYPSTFLNVSDKFSETVIKSVMESQKMELRIDE